MKTTSPQSRYLAPDNNIPTIQMGTVIDYNPSSATCTVRLSNGGLVRGMPVLGMAGSDHGTDISSLNNLRGSDVVVLRVNNALYVMSTVPNQLKTNEKLATTSETPSIGGDDKETYGVDKDKDYSRNRPKDYLTGDKILQAEGGSELGLLKEGIAKVKASPLSQFILGKIGDFGKLVTRVFSHYSDFGEIEHFSNNGKVGMSIKGGADYSTETSPGTSLWTIQAWIGSNPDNDKDRLFIKVNDKSGAEYVKMSFDIDGTAKISTSKDILGSAERDIEFSADEDLQLLSGENMSLKASGSGQYVANGKLLIKSDTALILKGPSRTIKL